MSNSSSKFNTEKLTKYASEEIIKFSTEHQNETFYGFSIDASLLCFNSEEQFQKTLKNYQEKWGGYDTSKKISDLKQNTGNWEYQGFAEFKDENGFNYDEYLEHYHEDDYDQMNTDYTNSMNTVLNNLKKSNAFDTLKKTTDFRINLAGHNY
jgi:hypothetical protein